MFYFVSKGYLKNYIYRKIVIPFSNSTKERGNKEKEQLNQRQWDTRRGQ